MFFWVIEELSETTCIAFEESILVILDEKLKMFKAVIFAVGNELCYAIVVLCLLCFIDDLKENWLVGVKFI